MIQQQRCLTRREREGQGEAVHAYGTCPLSKALHHPGEGERERERERDQHTAWHTQKYLSINNFFTNLPCLEVIQGMESIVGVLSLTHP